MTTNSIEEDANSLAVIAFRMGAVEKSVGELVKKFDGVQQFYVTNATLVLTLEPLKERIKELEDSEKERQQNKSSQEAQFKLAIAVAIMSPLFTIVMNLIMQQK